MTFQTPILGLSLLFCLAFPQALIAADWNATAWSFFETHCTECHDDTTTKGGLDLFALPDEIEGIAVVDRWTRIHDRIAKGEMPPPDKKQPTAGEVQTFLKAVAPPLDEGDRKLREVSLRRLNRIEYEHTVQDLLGIETDLKQLLPEDQKAGGFDNNGRALAVSAELIEQYLAAARLALDHAIVHGDAPETKTVTASPINELKRYFGKQYGHHDGRFVAYLRDRGNYSKISTRNQKTPHRGRYRFRFTTAVHNHSEPLVFSVIASDFKRSGATYLNLGYYEAKPEPQEVVIEAMLDEKFALQFFAHELPLYVKDPDLNAAAGIGYSEVEITGPLHPTWPPESHTRLLGQTNLATGTQDEADHILAQLAERAFRRPLASSELTRYSKLVAAGLAQGRSFEESLRVGLEAILCSTNFLFLKESATSPITDFDLATRLSYFLWSSLPDAKLLQAAKSGQLSDPKALTAEIDRMLKDPKSERFVQNFTGQWLKLREIAETNPDGKLYPKFDEVLQVSMVWESERFIRKLLEDNLNLTNFLDSEFAMLNKRLAEHYQIEGVSGLAMQPVSLPEDSVRGGVLTQASVLKVTANGTTTSPVLRGVWVLENILGLHIPPPPPNIAGIEPDIRQATTIREQLDLHRDSDSCRACHQHIDPPGFALESFDPIGAYRERYLQFKAHGPPEKGWGSVVPAKAVDPSGVMTTGERFTTIREFKALLLANSHQFAHCLAERLLTYGLGRELGFSDRPAIDEIVKRTKANGNGLRTLIHEIVLSETFRNP